MSYLSLQGSIRGCNVDAGWASKLQSDRFLNPNQMMCPVWTGVDTAGRGVDSEYGFYTKNQGCNSALDRVVVENDQRPKYMEYVTLDARGIRGDAQCHKTPENVYRSTSCFVDQQQQIPQRSGGFGNINGKIKASCLSCESQQMRRDQYKDNAYKVAEQQFYSGFN